MKTLEEKFEIFSNNISFYLPDRQYDTDLERSLDENVEWVKNTGKDLTAPRLYQLMEEDPVATFNFVRLAAGISMESIKNLFVVPKMLSRTLRNELNVSSWPQKYKDGNGNVLTALRDSREVREGMASLFIHGKNIDPSFCQKEEQNKYSLRPIHDLANSPDSIIRRTIEGRIRTTYKNQRSLRYEEIVRIILNDMNVPYVSGISEDLLRNMDCLIPNHEYPEVAIECSWFDTTSSGQSDKAKTFVRTVELMRKKNKDVKVFLFVGGVGWYRRQSDLKRMLEVCDDVFTYKRSQLRRFAETMRNLNLVQMAA